MDTGVDLHPDFGPSYGDGPNYGIPITVVSKKHARSKVSFDYSSESDHVKYPVGRDTKIEGGRDSDGDRHAIIVDKDKCKLYELYATSFNGRPLARRLRRGVVAEEEQAAPRRLDLRRRGRAADPARAAALERGQEEPGSTTRSGSPCRRDLPVAPLAGPPRRRLHVVDSTTRRWAPASGSRSSYDASGLSPYAQNVVAAMKKYGLVLADNGSAVVLPGRAERRAGPTSWSRTSRPSRPRRSSPWTPRRCRCPRTPPRCADPPAPDSGLRRPLR